MNWKDYQRALFEKLLYEFPPPMFKVIHDIKFNGKYSGGRRQVDVAVFRSNEKNPFLIAEAKFIRSKIDILHIDAFITKIKEVNAKIGIMVVSSNYTESEKRLANTFDIDLRIMTLEEALETQWLPIARSIFAFDWAFHPQIAAGLCHLEKNKDPEKIIEAIEDIPFDEWVALVQYAIKKHSTEAANFLWFIARQHYNEDWRFNAIQELISSDLIKRFDIRQIFESEQDREILDMLHEYGYS